ncbi:TPA: hypothetical protein PC685_002558 [Staphylococcus aureus]|uniref:hypothetical protein n=1 Tax=Staphylococcus TaxID=1279 RepID=UPI00091CACFE|nr:MULTISPECIES: hypothetical protein [Staphylococcus]HBI1053935.1 hypothetical protein [Staphylococcus aureus]EJH4613533.1 hypothetical protein [Staphylococcus pseudintermedius]REI05789.1 hypothetical protein DOS69_09515 [Staphylococcus felis]SHD20695.1 Uncharacterised protein [Staphylococcus argenteus]HDA2327701.1 hypothetical protein [Staphylococcus aureus]
MKKLIVSSLALSLLLVGCSNEEKEQTDSKPAEFGKTLNEETHFLSLYSSKDKNIEAKDKIERLAYIDQGKVTTYNVDASNLTLNKIANKSNEELLKIAKKEDKHAFNKQLENTIETHKAVVNYDYAKKENSKIEESEKQLSDVEDIKYIKPKSHDLKLSINVKNKKTDKETIELAEKPTSYFNMDQRKYEKDLNSFMPEWFNQTIATKRIGDNKFSGLQYEMKSKKDDTVYYNAVMKLKDNQSKVKFDNPKKSNDLIKVYNMD